MTDKIDMTQYVDHSMVFFDFLMNINQWSNISSNEYKKWLSNFDTVPNGHYIACRILNRLIYYSDKDVKKLIVDTINEIYNRQVVLPLQLAKGFSSMPSENEYEINEAIKHTLFIPLCLYEDAGASGPHIMRTIHNYYKPQVPSCTVTNILDSMCDSYDRIIIVDDFVGSGEQFREFWETAEIKDHTLLREWCVKHHIQANYLALIGYEKTLKDLNEEYNDISIIFAEVLDETHRIFSSANHCWDTPEEQETVRDLLKDELSKYGIRLFGFNELDFAVAIHDTIPDWSLPLLYKNNNGWNMLIERKDSYE